jgi:GntR family transcriptional regulator
MRQFGENKLGSKGVQIKLDFRSGFPIYVQIMDQIRKLVAAGDLKQGDQLPTVRQLATDLRINWNTVARAYRLLDEAGLISTQHGRGTYIWEAPSEETTRQLRLQVLEELTARYLSETARLGFSYAEVAATVEQRIAEWKNGDPPQEVL